MFLHVTTIDFRGLFLNHQTTASSTGVKGRLPFISRSRAPPCHASDLPEADPWRSAEMLVSSRL
jgi:hypothetical protein